MTPGGKPWHCAAELCTFSVTYPLSGSALTGTTENQSEKCPTKPTFPSREDVCFVPLIKRNRKGASYTPNGSPSCKDSG